jgi:RNAse (barnase) inhibitor barstar
MSSGLNMEGNARGVGSDSFPRNFGTCLGVLVFAVALSACGTLQGKFTPGQEADVGLFADQTFAMLSQADFTFARQDQIYTREFFNSAGDEEKRLGELTEEVEALFQDIIDYSLNLVVISTTNDTEAKRIAAYADSFEDPSKQSLKAFKVSSEDYEVLVADIRKQEAFRDALKTAQPILSSGGRNLNAVLNELVNVTNGLALKVEQRIDERYADVIRYQEKLEGEKYAILAGLEHVYEAYRGDKGAYDRLRASRAVRKQSLLPKGNPTDDHLDAIGEHLMARLKALHTIGEEIESDWKIYRAAHNELDRLYDKMMESINKARLLTIIWVHAHYQMALGRQTPAEWFDIKQAGGAAWGAVF